MHQKKSEVQIGKESIGISSDFNPTSPPYFITQKNPDFSNNHSNNDQVLHFQTNPPLISSNDYKIGALNPIQVTNEPDFGSIESPSSSNSTPRNHLLSNPHKRPLMNPTSSIVKSPTLPTSLDNYPFSSTPTSDSKYFGFNLRCPSLLLVFSKAKPAIWRLFRRFRHLRRIRVRLRLLLLLAFPFFYFLVSHPSHSFIVDFLSAFAFSAALLVSINIAIPKIPSIRVFLNRSFSFPIKLSSSNSASRPLPVFWSIGSSSKVEKKLSSGCWVQVYSNGDVYEGEFHKGKCAGSGVYYYYMSGRYEGDWVDGKYDGHGVETWARGSRYRGQYRQGLRHGFGVYRFYTGDVYAGEWCNGQSHGCGKHTCEDGSRYVGEFKWGVKHGLGHYHFRNGDSYAGEYFADKMHGFGVYKFSNGHRYEGAWHEGRREGLGMYTFRNGETQAGHWHNGILDVPSTQSATCPVSPVAVNHSKVLNVVQEAREAAERAYDVAKVDERVNRAVAAANRSANAARVAAVKAVQKQMGDNTHKHQTLAPIV